jgi:hypothetical protein
MKEPVDHIVRQRLPWRHDDEGVITECGLDAAEVSVIERDEFFQRVKDLGQQRAAMFTCMTCAQTARQWRTWEDDPRQVLLREITWERGSQYWHSRTDRGQLLRDELVAIAALIEAHRDEFEATITNSGARRDWLAMKAEREKKTAPGNRPVKGL